MRAAKRKRQETLTQEALTNWSGLLDKIDCHRMMYKEGCQRATVLYAGYPTHRLRSVARPGAQRLSTWIPPSRVSKAQARRIALLGFGLGVAMGIRIRPRRCRSGAFRDEPFPAATALWRFRCALRDNQGRATRVFLGTIRFAEFEVAANL